MAMGITASAPWAPLRPFPTASIIGTTPTDTCSLPVDEKFINKSCLNGLNLLDINIMIPQHWIHLNRSVELKLFEH